MITITDLTGEEPWEAHIVLDVCRDGLLYTTDTGYAFVDVEAHPDSTYSELTDRLIEHDLVAVGQPGRVQLDDGTYTVAQLDITDAGRQFFDQLTTALGL
ncbi:hypothetical protein [Amycolatopsis magusensis]|uniref:hypothetical protein n=1 Tax=Amycolatopsis magusensis TaxID=882444 RepID=UPI00378BD38F